MYLQNNNIKSKLIILRDSAILSLNEFNLIKQNSYFSPKSITKFPSVKSIDNCSIQNNSLNSNILSNDFGSNQNLEKALNHKKKIIDYEKSIDRNINRLFMEKIKIEDP